MTNPFRYFDSSPEVIRLVVMMYEKYPLSLRNVEDLLFERGIDICHETVRLWWNRFGPTGSRRPLRPKADSRDFCFGSKTVLGVMRVENMARRRITRVSIQLAPEWIKPQREH